MNQRRPVEYCLLYLLLVLDHITIHPHHGSDQSPWKHSLNNYNASSLYPL